MFFSGCPLSCRWCSNPEGQLARRRLMYRRELCPAGCVRCVAACPLGAIARVDGAQARLRIDRASCDRCDRPDCLGACLSEALSLAGREITVDALMRVLRRDQGFWGDRGGVTLSGGEPLFSGEFLLRTLIACRGSSMHTALETSAHGPTELLVQALRWLDWLFVDLKHLDPTRHREGTGVDNRLIVDNVEAVVRSGWPGRLVVRFTVVPGYNDDPSNLEALSRFLKELRLGEVHLLPFHRLGSSKYVQLGLEYAYRDVPAVGPGDLDRCRRQLEAAGLTCYMGADTPF